MDDALAQALGKALPVYYLASAEEALLREAGAEARRALLAGEAEAEATRVAGPAPDMGEVVAAAGAISFFGTRRVVELWQISPSAMADKDAAELAALFGEVENAVLLVTSLYKDKKAADSKKAKMLFAAAAKAGFAQELARPTRRQNLDFLAAKAAALGASFAPGAAEALLERAGEDRPLLENETAKLAAMAGYGQISRESVEKYAAHNVEADVFALSRAITSGRKAESYQKLAELLELRHEPTAIAAALAGSYVDMYRTRVGAEANKPAADVFKDMNCTGSPYRLQKARENARRYSTPALRQCILCLAGLDRRLKSSALPDKSILLQAAVGQLLRLGER